MSKLAVIAPCFYPDTTPARLLTESCQRHSLDLHLFGVGQPWQGDTAAHFTAAPQAIDALPAEVEVVVFTDAADTFVLTGEEEILGGCTDIPLLLSAEQGLYPWGLEEVRNLASAPYAARPWCHPNGGGWIAYRDGLVALLRQVSEEEWGEAQGRWVLAFSKGVLGIGLDYRCDLFQTMSQSSGDLLIRRGNRYLNKVTGSMPAILHFNGRCGGDGVIERWYANVR
jgi:hypothetical protein